MIKTITIIDNKDGTQKVYLHNFDKDGTEIKVDRSRIRFIKEKEPLYEWTDKHPFSVRSLKMTLEIQCFPNEAGGLVEVFGNRLTDDELLNELKKRNLLTEEKVYRVNKGQ